MPKTKAKSTKTTTRASKQEQQTICYLCKIVFALAIVLGIGFIGIIIGGCFKPKISHLEQRELEAFETLFYSYVSEVPFLEDNTNTTASITNIGLSEDDDLYADIVINYYNNNHQIIAAQKGKMFFQCDHENKKVITESVSGCGMAYSWEEKETVVNQ